MTPSLAVLVVATVCHNLKKRYALAYFVKNFNLCTAQYSGSHLKRMLFSGFYCKKMEIIFLTYRRDADEVWLKIFKKYMNFENVRTFESLPFLGCIAVLRM